MALAILLLIGLYFFPTWSIYLEAPQFPEGLGLNIWVNSIEGKAPQDHLQNINTLDHYIGMKPISPESIPELPTCHLLSACLFSVNIAEI